MAQTRGGALLERGRLAEAREQFWRDVEVADAAGDAEALAHAALGLGGIWVHEHRSTLDHARVEALQRRALAGLDPDVPLARRLRIRLAAEHAYLAGDPTPILTELDAARDQDDPVVIADALSLAHHCLLGPHHTALRMTLADELIAISPRTGRAVDGLMGLAWRTVDLFLAGDRRAVRSLSELRARLDLDRCDGLRYLVVALDVMLAVRAGRLDEAVEMAGECYELGLDVGDADALGWYGAQLVAIRWLQGRGDELLPLMEDFVHSTTIAEPAAGFVAATAALAGACGDHGIARSALACLRAGGLDVIASSSIWSATMLGACEAAHALGDVEAASEAYALLAPFAHLPVMASIAVACYGSTHRPLAMAAWTMGDLDLAVEHLEAAVVAELALGGGPWHAVACATLADVLDERGHPGDGDRAAACRTEAIEAANRLGMTARVTTWERLARRRDAHPEVRREGRVWRVGAGERAVVVAHSVGMGYLDRLVAQPGVEIPAIELASGHAITPWRPDPVLDPVAKAAYRARIDELHAEVDDADSCADLDRATRARAELDRYLEELSRATGLGGASRAFTDGAERARVSVHKAIKRALRAITSADPVLGHQLATRIVTGSRCVYRTS